MKKFGKCGFTLIELVLVIGIVAIISVIAIGKFTDFRKSAARKANVANIKNITRTINTEMAILDGETCRGMFAYAEALIDVDGSQAPTGAEGTYVWKDSWYDGNGGIVPGVYCGIKTSQVVENASGVSSGTVQDVGTAHESNTGLDSFASSLGMYYLTAKEVESLRDAGVSIVSYHNYSNAQSKNLGWASSEWATQPKYGLHATGGGPGMRADLSACFPVVLTNGMAVAVIDPSKSSIYLDLGLDYDSAYIAANGAPSDKKDYFAKGVCKRLVVVGLGRDCVATTKFFENHPRCATLAKTRYRNYLLVFQMNNGTGNSGVAAKFVGVLDPAGNTAKQAQYDADWSS